MRTYAWHAWYSLYHIDVASTACACTAHLDSALQKLSLLNGQKAFAENELSLLKGVVFFQKLPHFPKLREKYVRAFLVHLDPEWA
jgi:hypothetical protein